MSGGTADRAERPISFATPFRHPAFTVIWTATLVSNVGGWMYSAASGWLMTLLDADPLMVALVQAASSLPICLLAIPAGALADIFDKRRFLIVVEIITTIVCAVYALIVGLGDPGQPARVHISDRCRRRHDRAGMAGGRDLSRPQGRFAARDCRQFRRRLR